MGQQLTKKDIKKIEEEIEYRKLVVRKEAIMAVKEARAHGDLSENFEYHAAKKEKKKMRAEFVIWKESFERLKSYQKNQKKMKWD